MDNLPPIDYEHFGQWIIAVALFFPVKVLYSTLKKTDEEISGIKKDLAAIQITQAEIAAKMEILLERRESKR